MKIHKFRCNVCGREFGPDGGWGLTTGLDMLVNPHNSEHMHLCESCLYKIAALGASTSPNLVVAIQGE